MEGMPRRVTVRGLIIKDNTVFAVRHKHDYNTTNSFWCTPGGGLDDKETLHDGVTRELIEETGVTPQIGKLLIIQQFPLTPPHIDTGNDEILEFFFHIENAEDYETIDLDATTHGAVEIAEYGFVDPTKVDFLPVVLKTLNLAALVTKNSPVVITSEL
ncbi:MAG: NUDIX hydrolase [Candidatus Saccharimonadales bacterium]